MNNKSTLPHISSGVFRVSDYREGREESEITESKRLALQLVETEEASTRASASG